MFGEVGEADSEYEDKLLGAEVQEKTAQPLVTVRDAGNIDGGEYITEVEVTAVDHQLTISRTSTGLHVAERLCSSSST